MDRHDVLYNTILNDIIEPVLGDETTYSTDLNKLCKKLFKNKFVGVFPCDKIPKLKKGQYAILNLDKSNQKGSHWVSIYKKPRKTIIYDSFGRDNGEIIPSLSKSGNGKIIDTDKDVEQSILETNCGARCVAWLCLIDGWGINMGMKI